jgi:hypothetical protein
MKRSSQLGRKPWQIAEQVKAVLGDVDGLLAAVEVASTSPATCHGGSTLLRLSVNASGGTSTTVISRPVDRRRTPSQGIEPKLSGSGDYGT